MAMTKRKTFTSFPQEYWPGSKGIHDLVAGDRFTVGGPNLFTFVSAERSKIGWWVKVEELGYRLSMSKNTRLQVRKPDAQPS